MKKEYRQEVLFEQIAKPIKKELKNKEQVKQPQEDKDGKEKHSSETK